MLETIDCEEGFHRGVMYPVNVKRNTSVRGTPFIAGPNPHVSAEKRDPNMLENALFAVGKA